MSLPAVGKKITAAGKAKDAAEDIGLWGKAIKNHLYYAILTTDGKGGESITNICHFMCKKHFQMVLFYFCWLQIHYYTFT